MTWKVDVEVFDAEKHGLKARRGMEGRKARSAPAVSFSERMRWKA
jgi:hypothetical protein